MFLWSRSCAAFHERQDGVMDIWQRCMVRVAVVGLLVVASANGANAPLRYRHPMEAGGFQVIVSEYGALEGTSPDGEQVQADDRFR